MLDKAWKDHKRDQRSEKKLPKEEATKPETDGKKTNAKLPRAKGRKQEK
jgi:hypothetical protein